MRGSWTLPLIAATALIGGCDGPKTKTPALNPSMQTEEEDAAERGNLLNAVEQHPSLQDPSQAAPPVTVPTTIPPPAPDSGNMAGHDNMDDHGGQPPADSNQQDPSTTN